ncbi:MAG: DUF4249 family protein [Saprospiraceae bacterium]
MIYLKKIKAYAISMVLLLYSSCLSEIQLEAPKIDIQSLAITASLFHGAPSIVSVNLSRVANFIEFDFPSPENDAIVLLVDENGRRQYIPNVANGYYELKIVEAIQEFPIAIGKSYQIQVITGEGKTYASTFEPLQAVPKPSGISLATEKKQVINESGNIVDQQFIRFFIDTPITKPDNSGKAILKWDIEGTYKFVESTPDGPSIPNVRTCYIKEILQRERPVIFNGKESSKAVLSQHFIIEEPLDHRFSRGFYLTVFQQSISEGAVKYWDQIRKVVDLNGNFFESPPGKIRGNFQNIDDSQEDVFGYFYAAQQDTIRVFVPQSVIGETIFPLCPGTIQAGQEPPFSTCYNCLSIPNSSTQKPYYWIE